VEKSGINFVVLSGCSGGGKSALLIEFARAIFTDADDNQGDTLFVA